jgi:hypothetical protein
MRIAAAIFACSIAAFPVLTAPVLARNSDAQRTDGKSTAAPCTSYERVLNGEWKPIPCQEVGPGGPTQHKPSAGSADDATH